MHCLLLLKFNEDKIKEEEKKSYDEIIRALIYSQKKEKKVKK